MVCSPISNWHVQNIRHNFFIQSKYSDTLFEITTGARNYTPIYSKMWFFCVRNVSSYKISKHVKFLNIQNLFTFKSSLHLKFLHVTKKSPRTMFTASGTNIKYALGPTQNAIEHVMFGVISWCRIALLWIRYKIVWCPIVRC